MSVLPIKVEVRYPSGVGGFSDISNFLRDVSISRGKGSETDDFESGSATVTLNNFNREFDPSFGGSEFGNIVQPAGDLRITANNIRVFTGKIYDWNLSYNPNGESIASLSASDAFVDLAQREIEGVIPNEERADERIAFILERPEVDFAFKDSKFSPAVATVAGQEIDDGARVLDYIQEVARSEPGRLFIDREGDLVFRSRLDSLFRTEFTFTRRNLSINPSFENENVDGWTGGDGNLFASDSQDAFVGNEVAFLARLTGEPEGLATQKFQASGSTTYTLSLYVKSSVNQANTATLRLADSTDFENFETVAEQTVSLETFDSNPDWVRLNVTGTTRQEAVEARLEIATPEVIFFDAVLIEETTELREYFDGDNAPADTDEETFVASWET